MPSFAQLATNQISDLVAYLESDAEDDEQSIPTGPSGHYAQVAPFFEDPYGAPQSRRPGAR
jgi:hypothetical protein